MQYSQEHLKTMVYAKFGEQTECIMGNWKIENRHTEIMFTSLLGLKCKYNQRNFVKLIETSVFSLKSI